MKDQPPLREVLRESAGGTGIGPSQISRPPLSEILGGSRIGSAGLSPEQLSQQGCCLEEKKRALMDLCMDMLQPGKALGVEELIALGTTVEILDTCTTHPVGDLARSFFPAALENVSLNRRIKGERDETRPGVQVLPDGRIFNLGEDGRVSIVSRGADGTWESTVITQGKREEIAKDALAAIPSDASPRLKADAQRKLVEKLRAIDVSSAES